MNVENEDILVDIPDKDLMELYRKYEKHIDWAPQACCAIDSGMKWRKRIGGDCMVFMSPNSSWREDGTFILLMQIAVSSYEIFVFTLDDECKNLYKGLMETRRIEYDRKPRIVFLNTHNKFYTTVKKVMEIKSSSKVIVFDAEITVLSKEDALSFTVSCPPEVYTEDLRSSDAFIVNKYWPYQSPGSEATIKAFIEGGGGIGLHLRSNNEIIAWILIGPLGQMCILHVLDEYRRRGYAAILLKMLANRISKENGQIPYGTVSSSNIPSLSLLKKLNFKIYGLAYFIISRNCDGPIQNIKDR